MSLQAVALHPLEASRAQLRLRTGGRVRARVLFLLAGVLALDTADVSMIGAVAGKLERALALSNTELGLLAAVPSLFAAVATVPVGMLTDRVNRVRLIAATVVLWGVAMAVSGTVDSFGMLLLTRMALGAATATAGPTIASLVGDFFAPRTRARMYGLILSGELAGAGLGFVVSGILAGALSWRWPFFVLAVPSLVLALAFWRWLPEPPRGGRGWRSAPMTRSHRGSPAGAADDSGEEAAQVSVVQRKVDEEEIAPRPELVVDRDPQRMALKDAVRLGLRVPTNRVLIISSGLGYFYLSGVETFGLVFFRGHFGLSQAAATLTIGALGLSGLVGVIGGGRLADMLVGRGVLDGRILVGAISSLAAGVLFLPALLSPWLAVSLPLFVGAAAAFAARNPALDAARLDIMHHRLWGRAEAVRTVLRRLMVAAAPLSFGAIADGLAQGHPASAAQHGFGSRASASGLEAAFAVLLVTLLISGVLTLRARRSYPVDVASAVASEKRSP